MTVFIAMVCVCLCLWLDAKLIGWAINKWPNELTMDPRLRIQGITWPPDTKRTQRPLVPHPPDTYHGELPPDEDVEWEQDA